MVSVRLQLSWSKFKIGVTKKRFSIGLALLWFLFLCIDGIQGVILASFQTKWLFYNFVPFDSYLQLYTFDRIFVGWAVGLTTAKIWRTYEIRRNAMNDVTQSNPDQDQMLFLIQIQFFLTLPAEWHIVLVLSPTV